MLHMRCNERVASGKEATLRTLGSRNLAPSCCPGTMSYGFDGSVVQAIERRLVAPETQVRILPLPPLHWPPFRILLDTSPPPEPNRLGRDEATCVGAY